VREGGSAIHPTDAIVRAGRVGKGLTKGGGVLLGWTIVTRCHDDENFIMAAGGKWLCRSIFVGKPTLGVDFGNVVAGTTHANVPLRRQSWERVT
jgi:hypothetical protein